MKPTVNDNSDSRPSSQIERRAGGAGSATALSPDAQAIWQASRHVANERFRSMVHGIRGAAFVSDSKR